jgi:hypothetical protein
VAANFARQQKQGSFSWLQSEGGINSGWCTSGRNHSLAKKGTLTPEKKTLNRRLRN